jgi:hypothetical protein
MQLAKRVRRPFTIPFHMNVLGAEPGYLLAMDHFAL